jgi:hypothetical protein
MKACKRVSGLKKLAVMSTMGTAFAFPLGACDLGEFTTTQTVALDGREVVTYLVRSAILTPIDNLITRGVDAFFDRFDDEED